MRWHVHKVVQLRPPETLADKLGAVFLLVLLSPLLLVLAAGILVLLAVAGLYHLVWNRWRPSAPNPEPVSAPAPPVCVLDTPTLRIELTDEETRWPPELEQLSAEWPYIDDAPGLSLATTTPALPGLHGRLVTGFSRPWHGGLLLQVVEAGAGGAAVTSWLGWADPVTLTWQPLAEAGEFALYHPESAPDNVIEGWNQAVGKMRLELQPEPTVNS